MSVKIGEVIAVNGIKIVLKIDEESSKETLFLLDKNTKEFPSVNIFPFNVDSRTLSASSKENISMRTELRTMGERSDTSERLTPFQ